MNARTETSQASITALSVASAFQRGLNKYPWMFTQNEEKIIEHICDQAVTPIPAFSMNGFFARTLSVSPYGAQTLFFNQAVWPYYAEYVLLRKYIIKEKIHAAIANGAKQIVFLGGGYDIRSFICAQEYPQINFYELDRGETRETKLLAMQTLPYEKLGYQDIEIKKKSNATIINKNLFYLECDFNHDNLCEILKNYGFNNEEMSLLIVEGVTMYLDEAQNKKTLNLAHDLMTHQNSELLIGYRITVEEDSGLAKLARKEAKEDYKFHIPPQEIIPFAAECELSVTELKQPMLMLVDLKAVEDECDLAELNIIKQGEEYYIFKNQNYVLDKIMNIDDVPKMNVLIPDNPEQTQSNCLQM